MFFPDARLTAPPFPVTLTPPAEAPATAVVETSAPVAEPAPAVEPTVDAASAAPASAAVETPKVEPPLATS